MAVAKAGETKKLSATTTSQEVDFVAGVTGLMVYATVDCHIDFDSVTATTSSFFIKGGVEAVYIPVECTKVNARTASGTGDLYLIGIR